MKNLQTFEEFLNEQYDSVDGEIDWQDLGIPSAEKIYYLYLDANPKLDPDDDSNWEDDFAPKYGYDWQDLLFSVQKSFDDVDDAKKALKIFTDLVDKTSKGGKIPNLSKEAIIKSVIDEMEKDIAEMEDGGPEVKGLLIKLDGHSHAKGQFKPGHEAYELPHTSFKFSTGELMNSKIIKDIEKNLSKDMSLDLNVYKHSKTGYFVVNGKNENQNIKAFEKWLDTKATKIKDVTIQ